MLDRLEALQRRLAGRAMDTLAGDLVHDLLQVARVGGIPELRDFRRHIDPAWVEEALQATGTATMRRRRLPAERLR